MSEVVSTARRGVQPKAVSALLGTNTEYVQVHAFGAQAFDVLEVVGVAEISVRDQQQVAAAVFRLTGQHLLGAYQRLGQPTALEFDQIRGNRRQHDQQAVAVLGQRRDDVGLGRKTDQADS